MIVTIIIPAHITTPFLKQCVESALNQTYKKIEVLIICNGTLTINACKNFLDIHDSKLIFSQSKEGRHHARNKGLLIAKGDYIQFLDYDDILFLDKIEKQLQTIQLFQEENLISISKWNLFNEKLKKNSDINLVYLFSKPKISGLEFYKLLGKHKGYIMTASWLIPKNSIKNVLWEDVPNDDALFISEIINANTYIITVPSILTTYRNHTNNTRIIRTKKQLRKLIYSWKKIRKNLKKMNHYLVSRYFFNAHFYMLKYSVNCKGYHFFRLLWTFNFLGFRGKVPFFTILKKNKELFNKTTTLIVKKMTK